jgi:trehalose/maltose transport system substrate-binding protein
VIDNRASARRTFLRGLVGMGCGSLLAACGRVTQPASSAPQPTSATVATTAPPIAAASGQSYAVDNPPTVPNAAEARRYSGLKIAIFPFGQSVRLLADINDAKARRFTQDTGIEVQVLRQPQDVAANGTATFAFFESLLQSQSRDVDVLSVDVVWTGAFAPHLVDLNPRLGIEAQQHYPAIIQNNTVSGRLIGMPAFGDVGMLYYRTDLLQKYGFDAPPRTWEQLEQQAHTIVEGESRSNSSFTGFVFQGAANEALTCNALEWLASSGGGSIADNQKVTVNNPQAVAILNRMRRWIGTVSPRLVTSYAEENARTAFQTGNSAFMRNWPYAYALCNSADSPVKGKFDVAPLPASAGQTPVGTVGGFQWAVSRYSRAVDASIEWVSYASSPEAQAYHAVLATTVPTIPAVAAQPEVLQAEPFLSKLQGVTRVTRPSGVFSAHYADASAVFFQAVSQILNGQDAGVVLPDVQRQLERLLGAS